MVNEEIILGVPPISPVEESIMRPLGNDGYTSQDVTAPPPPTVGVTDVIAVPLVSTKALGEYEIDDGMISLTVMSTVVEAPPPVLFA